ncbi:MAG: ATP-binding protein [Myxococcota bacterium]
MNQRTSSSLESGASRVSHSKLRSTDRSEHYLKVELDTLVQRDASIFEFIQAGSLDGIWYWDLEHKEHEWMSPRFKEVFGFEDHEMANTPQWWQDNIHPEDLQTALKNFEAHCADPECPYDQVVRYRHRDGSTKWIRCRGIVLRSATGVPVRMLGAHTDLTEQKRVEQELRSANEKLKRSNDDLQAFAYAVSHDLLGPLRTIVGLTSLLREDLEGEPNPDIATYLCRIDTTSERLRTCSRELLRYARLDADSEPLLVVDLQHLVEEVLESLDTNIQEAEATIECRQLPMVMGYPAQLASLFSNLIGNALKFRGDAPARIQIGSRHLETEPSQVEIRVADEGIGFSGQHANQIFELFRQLKQDLEGGVGMGLALCKRIVSRHGGEIRAESELGKGSCFIFTLPAKEPLNMSPKAP